MANFLYLVLLTLFIYSSECKDLKRSKRQLQVYYMCAGGVSQYPCSSSNNCGSSCNYNSYSSPMILPTSFYNPGLNCNSNCNSFNCNQYTGSWINGQYVAYSLGSNAYSPCASSCCSNNGNYNPYSSGMTYNPYGTSTNGNNGVYNPYDSNNNFNNGGYNPYSTGTGGLLPGYNPYGSSTNPGCNPYGMNTNGNNGGYNPYGMNTNGNNGGYNPYGMSTNGGYQPYSNMPLAQKSFTGTYRNGVFLCGATEPSGGVCQNNGVCPSGHSCVAGNVCCRCPVGTSAGICTQKSDCSNGYECAGTGYCCPSNINAGTVLDECINSKCPDDKVCGVGNLCYPPGYFQ